MNNEFVKIRRVIGAFAVLLISLFLLAPALATETAQTPVGTWKSVDDNTGKARSHIKIWEFKGKLYGKIVKLLNEKEENPLCKKCPGKLKDSPVLGLTIIRGLTQDGNQWQGGTILDPETGKTYKVLLELQNGGKKMKVRGYIGFSLLGRTQYWQRVR